ncbi:MAG: hypothetical protein R3253_15925, partial [Longimicrobiales bacterium]|nr:hypothetical protein [Longimicrobiales bacterium]
LRHEGTSSPLRISVGVSACPDCVDGGERLRESADAALYEAKRAGRDRVAVAESPRIPNPGPG